jgi:hypothetical protein
MNICVLAVTEGRVLCRMSWEVQQCIKFDDNYSPLVERVRQCVRLASAWDVCSCNRGFFSFLFSYLFFPIFFPFFLVFFSFVCVCVCDNGKDGRGEGGGHSISYFMWHV